MSTGTALGVPGGAVTVDDAILSPVTTLGVEAHVKDSVTTIIATATIHSLSTTGESAFKLTVSSNFECHVIPSSFATTSSIKTLPFPARPSSTLICSSNKSTGSKSEECSTI